MSASSSEFERRDWLIAGALSLLFFAGVLLLVVFANRYIPLGCERDYHFRLANRLLCEPVRLVRSTVGPLVPWLTALLTGIAGTTYLAGKLVSMVLGALSIGLTYLIGRRAGMPAVASTAGAVVTGVNAHFIYFGSLACTDMAGVFFVLLMLFFLLGAIAEPKQWYAAAWAGIAGLAACLTRDQNYFALAGAGATLAVLSPGGLRGRTFRTALFAASFFAAMGIYLLVSVKLLGSEVDLASGLLNMRRRTWEFDAAVNAGGEGARFVAYLSHYLSSLKLLLHMAGYVTALGVLGALVWIRWHRTSRLLLAMLIPLLVYFFGVGWLPTDQSYDLRRFFLAFLPLLSLLYVMWIIGLFAKSRQRRVTGAALIVVPVILLGVWQFPQIAYFHESKEIMNTDLHAARAFVAKQAPGCAPVMTPSLQAATQFRQFIHLKKLPVTNETVAEQLDTILPGQYPQLFLMAPDTPLGDQLDLATPLPTQHPYSVKPLTTLHRYRFYRLTELPD